MSEYIGQIVGVISIFILAFGLLIGEESLRAKFSRSGSLALRWAVYSVLDYGLMFLSIALVVLMTRAELKFWFIFLIMWIFNIAMAAGLLQICYYSGQDLTLGQEYRNSMNNIKKKSKIAGLISLVFIVIKASIWDGPERLVEFLKTELNTRIKKWSVILGLCFIQALFWTSTYFLGYESISKLWEVVKLNVGM